MIVVNLYGVPNSRKSTVAAYLFQFFKNRGFECELIAEFAKKLTYSARHNDLENQFYVSAKQCNAVANIAQYGKVPFVITDSPILLGLAYSEYLPYYNELKALLFKLNGQYQNINILLERVGAYSEVGRNQTKEESDALAPKIRAIFDEANKKDVLMAAETVGTEQGQLELANWLLDYFLEAKKSVEIGIPI